MQQANAAALAKAIGKITSATQQAWKTGEPEFALANAVPYMQAFGHMVLAWIWLDLSLASRSERADDHGRRHAAQFFFDYELPKMDAWLGVVSQRNMTCAHMPEDAF
jgi:butyryl-CoA dehydrogenase